MEKYIVPVRITAAENCVNCDSIVVDSPRQAVVIPNHDKTYAERCVTIKRNGYILLDFGKELHGGICITVQSANGSNAMLEAVFGESAMEALSKRGEKNSDNYHSIRYWAIPAVAMSTQEFGSTGFRFVKISAVDADITLSSVKAVLKIRDLEYKGSFECNDGLLNEIWKTGAYTVHLNMHDYIWDGIKRDRLVWIGDMHPEVSTINAVFGNDSSIMRSLDLIKNLTPAKSWMNNIASYSMWWIIIQYDMFMHWGNIDYLEKQREYLTELVDRAAECVDGGFELDGYFIDWSSKDTPGERDGCKSVFCMAFWCAARIFEALRDEKYSLKCDCCSRKLSDGKTCAKVNKSTAALSVLSGRDTDDTKKIICGNSVKDMSCFMGYYVLLAKAKLGNIADALDIIREYWGGMLKMGATTFWEDFDIEWMQNAAGIDCITPAGKKDIHGDFGRYCYTNFRHSLCHGWASGPTAFLSQHVLGIRPTSPGFNTVAVSSDIGALEWVRGTYPTPYGNIYAEHKRKGGRIVTEYCAPSGIKTKIINVRETY